MVFWQGILLIIAGFIGGWWFCSMMTISKVEDMRTEFIQEAMRLQSRINDLEEILYRKEK